MKDLVICNAVPLYNEAPVAARLINEKIEEVQRAMKKVDAKNYVIVAPKNGLLYDLSECVQLIETSNNHGFTYGNISAVLSLIEGEKAYPNSFNVDMNSQKIVMKTVEEFLDAEEKTIYVKIDDFPIEEYQCKKNLTLKELLTLTGALVDFKGIYLGYPMSHFLTKEQLEDTININTDYIEIYTNKSCMLDRLFQIMERFTHESCGRCVFGYEGVTQIHMILAGIVQKKAKNTDIELMLDLCLQMKHQSLCEIGQVAGSTVLSAFDCFGEEIQRHVTKKICEAGICANYVTYHVLTNLCTGCNECQDVCEEEAILGRKRFIHVIDQDECIQCGKCVDACGEDAIVKAGLIKPVGPKKPIPVKR